MDLNLTQLPESKGSFIERRQIDLPANHTKSVNVYGRVFFCNASTGPFEMNFNDGEFFHVIGRGVEWALIGDDRYNRLQFRAAASISIEFYAGNFAYHENVVIPVSKVAQTLIKPLAMATETVNGVISPLPLTVAAPVVSLPGLGATGSGLGYRKHAIIGNLNSGDGENLIVLDSGNRLLGSILPQQTHVFETSADLKLKNYFNVAALYYSVMEIFYPA
jgi:hypothetical protein